MPVQAGAPPALPARALPFRIEPESHELLSGYLCRVARRYGTTPYALCALHFSAGQYWSRDPDRGVLAPLMTRTAQGLGLPEEVVLRMTLAPWIARLAPTSGAKPAWACTPWINAVGVFHRTRRLHGLAWCPECLAETGVVQRLWRLSFVVACERHGRILSDACHGCAAPFVPHRSARGVQWCHRCAAWLGATPAVCSNAALAELLAFQSQALTELWAPCPDDPVAAPKLQGLRCVVALGAGTRQWERFASSLDLDVTGHRLQAEPAVLEKMRLVDRVPLLLACARVLADPSVLRPIAGELGWSARALRRCGAVPAWLEAALGDLPAGHGRRRTANGPIEARIALIDRERAAGWRGEQARLLMKAAARRRTR